MTTDERHTLYTVLSLLDDIATRECNMSMDDISDLCKARELLASFFGFNCNDETDRYTALKGGTL